MKTKAKRRPFSRVVCVLLTVLTVFGAMSSLFLTEPLEAKAASSWKIISSSSEVIGSSIWYYGYDYENKKEEALLEFEFTSGYTVEYGDQIYYASCAQMGYAQPTNQATFDGLLTIPANGKHNDNFNNREKYGAHYIGNDTDPTWGKGRETSYDFIFRCFYYAHKLYPNGVDGTSVLWTNGFMEEAVSIAYRYEWDTRLMQKVTGHFVGNTWTPYAISNWTQNKNFSNFLSANPIPVANAMALVNAADEILNAALTDSDRISGKIENSNPKTGESDNYGIYYKDGSNNVHVLRRLDTGSLTNSEKVPQDLFLYAVNETPPPPEEKYNIYLYKKDADTNENLSGATFALYQKTGSSWSLYSSLPYQTTDSSGYVGWADLPAGDYRVRETSAPSGYELNNAQIDISFPNGTNKSVSRSYTLTYSGNDANVTVYESPETYKVAVQKEDERYTEQRRYLTGAWFALYKDNGTGTYVQYGEEQETKQRDVGLCAYWSGLPKGDYYVKETRAPSGYALNDTKVYFSLPYTDADGERGSTYRINQWDGSNADLFMSNVKYGNLKIKKVDIKGNPISGVTFGVYTSSSKTGYVKSATTGTDGVATFTDLLPGTYYLFETYAPSGYKFDPSKYYSGTVVSDTTTWANGGYGVENPPYSYSIELVKKRAGGDFAYLSGVTFTLYKQDNSGSYTFGGRRYAFCKTGTTNSSGQINWTGLEEGDYCYVETSVPRGIEKDTTPHYVSFPKDGNGLGKYTKYIDNDPEIYWTPQVEKVLSKATTIAENDFGFFTFTLEEWNGSSWDLVERKSINGSGTVTFSEIAYGRSDVGTHMYRVYEENTNNKKVSYDVRTIHTVTFTVTVTLHRATASYDWDRLEISTSVSSSQHPASASDTEKTTFTNYVPSGSWKANASKVLVGRWLNDDEFTFVLEENVGGTWTTLQTVKNREDHVVPFAGIYYTLENVGTHTYRVREVKGTDSTVIYDDHTVTYTVTVSYDRKNGTALTITESVSSSDPDMDKSKITTFTNYVPVKIEIEKDDPDGKTLAGAEFCLEWSEDGTTWANVKYTAEIEKGGCENADVVDGKLTTDDDGKIAYERLYPGLHYRLTETKAPDGMQLLTETAYEGVLPPDMTVTDPETLVSLRVVNQPVFTLPATGTGGFWNAALAVPLLCVSIAIIGLALGGGSFKKKKQK